MPLLTQNQRINSQVAQLGRDIARHLAAAANAANRQARTLLDLDDNALTAWLNSQPAADTTALFAAHANLGAALNAASDVAAAVLSEAGLPAGITSVDIRPVADKLAKAGRKLEVTPEGQFVVTTPEPEPEP